MKDQIETVPFNIEDRLIERLMIEEGPEGAELFHPYKADPPAPSQNSPNRTDIKT